MTTALFWGILIVIFGAWGTVIYSILAFKRLLRRQSSPFWLDVIITLVCAYSTILWGGHITGMWIITPEYGRPAMALAIAALIWLGFLGERPVNVPN